MKDKLCVSDRRRKMLDLLRVNRQLLKRDLADMFNVSVRTISRDILYLSSIAPITIKGGKGGGVCLESEFRQYGLYLSDEEENFLYSLMDSVDDRGRNIISGIIAKFTKNTVFREQN